MAVTRLPIKEFLAAAENALVLDVRSPGEYHHAHLPGALSLPLFTDEERKVVGTAYKQVSREKAIKIGLDFFGPKMRKMVEDVELLVADRNMAAGAPGHAAQPHQEKIYIYCWRGGMRSGAVAWLLELYGFKIATLAGGYKSFRTFVLDSFRQPFSFKVLGGYTGSGKTEVISELSRRGEVVVDLEKIASHKGSAFGNINMPPQPSQEMFENLLCLELIKAKEKSGNTAGGQAPEKSSGGIWLEDESQRIGDLNLPNSLWETMRKAPVYFLEIPFEERLNHLVQEYGLLDRERLASAIERISKRLGGLETKHALEFLAGDNIRECFRILLHYYDKRYRKALENRNNLPNQLRTINCPAVTPDNAQWLLQPEPVS